MVVVVFGLSGTGKSFVSRLLTERFGYEWLRSDEIRKELAGIKPEEDASAPFGEGIYTEEMTRRVYEEMVERANRLVGEGRDVVLDATFLRRWQRDLVGRRFPDALFVLTVCDEGEVRRRLASRKDVSDADWEIYIRQKAVFEPPQGEEYVELDTAQDKEKLLKVLEDLLKDEAR